MIPRITAGALGALAIIALSGSLPASPVAACNRMDGCIHDAQLENYKMMHDGGMSAAMRDGSANIEEFRSGTTANQRTSPRPATSGRPGQRR
ncbi:MAG TPA: hypothetical protein VGN91_13190 [Bosea sp. (in: a-proteobacteria)]|jgi:hypothetical protein|nr:hypothetical protein [Bosea sp. (in: a-proteobacteria)]